MQKKWKKRLASVAPCLVGGLIGVPVGLFITHFSDSVVISPMGIALLFLGVIAAIYLQMILHEGGHLIGGLLSGYRFVSFRIGSLTLVRRNGTYSFARFSIPGTGGQCLMAPPEGKDAPVMLYNLAGGLSNIVFSLLAVPFIFFAPFPWAPLAFIFAAFGIIFSIMNLVPLNMGGISNDGHNARSLSHDPVSRRAFLTQMWVVGRQADGQRLREMPEEWFILSEDVPLSNPLLGSVAYFHACLLVDRGDYAKAKADLFALTNGKNQLLGLHRNECILEYISCALMTGKDPVTLRPMLSPELKKYARLTEKSLITRHRQNYIWALLTESDEASADISRKKFDSVSRRYPFPVEVTAEREMMDTALSLYRTNAIH